jgi:hypothetical protein
MKKAISFEADGNLYQLRFDINVMCQIEDLLGRPISQLGEQMSIKELRLLFMCGLNPKCDVEETGEVMSVIASEHGINRLNELVQDALALAVGEQKSQEELVAVANNSKKTRPKK